MHLNVWNNAAMITRLVMSVIILGVCLAKIFRRPQSKCQNSAHRSPCSGKVLQTYAELCLRRSVLLSVWFSGIWVVIDDEKILAISGRRIWNLTHFVGWSVTDMQYMSCSLQVLFLQKYCLQNYNVCTPDSIVCFEERMRRGLREKEMERYERKSYGVKWCKAI